MMFAPHQPLEFLDSAPLCETCGSISETHDLTTYKCSLQGGEQKYTNIARLNPSHARDI
jgi:hypothetical protein